MYEPEYIKYDHISHQALIWSNKYRFEIKNRLIFIFIFGFSLLYCCVQQDESIIFDGLIIYFGFMIGSNIYGIYSVNKKLSKQKKIIKNSK